jgi:hypothetical protein
MTLRRNDPRRNERDEITRDEMTGDEMTGDEITRSRIFYKSFTALRVSFLKSLFKNRFLREFNANFLFRSERKRVF